MNTTRRSVSTLFLALVLLMTVLGGLAHARTYGVEETRFLQLVNDYRAQHGLGALKLSGTVSEAAARHSLDMGTYRFFGHTSEHSNFFPAGSTPWDRMELMGYPSDAAMAENIAAGQATAAQVFDAWRTSSGHNKNMLNSSYLVIGIARRIVPGSPYDVYWTTDFGSEVDASAGPLVPAAPAGPFSDVTQADPELWAAASYVKSEGLFEGYPSGSLGCWDPMTHRHIALVLERARLGSRPEWEQDYSLATRGEVMEAFPGLSWNSGRADELVTRSQLVRLLYRAR
jgi:hypothetical protein